jgi:hypothetical protein
LEHENNLLSQANSNYKKEIFNLKANLQDNREANKYLMDYIKNQNAEISRLKEENICLEREVSLSKAKLESALGDKSATTGS